MLYGKFCVELAPVDSEVADIANAIMHDTENAISKAIKKGQDAGVFTKHYSARTLARFVLNSLNGLRVTVKFDTNKKCLMTSSMFVCPP